MAGFSRRLRQFATRAAFAAVTAFAVVPSADAQWFPFGAAPPGEIVQRLQAEGYVLLHPLQRRDTVYLADVAGGPAGHERLVLDAWSGEILQRFVARRGGFVPEGGEFSEPPPLGPPPPRDFREGNYGYGSEGPPGGGEAPPRARVRSRPAATARRGGEPKQTTPTAQPVETRNAGTGSPGAVPAAPATAASPAAAPANPNAAGPAKAETAPANASSEPSKGAQPKPAAASSPAAAAAAPANPPSGPAEKPSGKKVNDVPVNPLD
ncbi:MAG TPA: hypothetical protein VJY34_04325 [Roseiarcus sp.]|nr:hypothetical protein [Roseiarcus sp.]